MDCLKGLSGQIEQIIKCLCIKSVVIFDWTSWGNGFEENMYADRAGLQTIHINLY